LVEQRTENPCVLSSILRGGINRETPPPLRDGEFCYMAGMHIGVATW